MMQHICSIKQCLNGSVVPQTYVTIQGWVRTRRDSKAGVSFIHVHDGSCHAPIQLVVPSSLQNYMQEILKLTSGCSIRATGQLVASQGQGQTLEIQATHIDVIGWVENPDSYPIASKKHTLEHLRDFAHLRPRTNTIGAVARIRDCIS